MGAGSPVLALFAFLSIAGTLGVLPEYPIGREEMEVRGEYYTGGGKYLGGIPMHREDVQFFECTRFNSDGSSSSTTDSSVNSADGIAHTSTNLGVAENATVCLSWTANKIESGVVHEEGRCSCQSVASDSQYCEAWTCGQLGTESARCTCEAEGGDSRKFCSSWTCVQTDSDGTHDVGEYQCVTASDSPGFCETWTGLIEWSARVRVSSCACAEQWKGVRVCQYWECKERDLTKCSQTRRDWCNIGVSLGVGGLIGSLGAMGVAFCIYSLKKKGLRGWVLRIALGVLWMAIWSTGVVVWGGQDGAMYVGVWWGAIIASGFLCRCFATHRHRITACLATCRDGSTNPLALCRERAPKLMDKLDAPIPN